MVFKLKVVGGDLEVNEVTLELPAILGRGKEAALSLVHPLVSRQHCELYVNDGRVMVRDLGSLNGTYVGSERIQEGPLLPGELLTVGTVTFRAEYDWQPVEGADASTAAAGARTTRIKQKSKIVLSPVAGKRVSSRGADRVVGARSRRTVRQAVGTVDVPSGDDLLSEAETEAIRPQPTSAAQVDVSASAPSLPEVV